MRAIGLEVKDSVEREESLLGIVYAEDAATGRSPTAVSVDVTRVCATPTRLSGYEHLERLGNLCLRHPLPAVVFSETQPGTSFIHVASTRRALGRELPMFLSLTGCVEIVAQVFALSGVFYIPVRDERIGDLWGGVIQNSVSIDCADCSRVERYHSLYRGPMELIPAQPVGNTIRPDD